MRRMKEFLKLYNILSCIYLFITVQQCHIHEIRNNSGKKINTKRNS